MFKNKKGFIIKLRQSRTFKGISVYLILNLLFQIAQPSVSLALTEGPSQPEVQKFEPIGTTQMVDMFTGDFNYNIPLFNLPGPNGGYPVNLSYHAGSTIDDESSVVGLGWNINVGSLVRTMRGLPDEFKSIADANDPMSASNEFDYLNVQNDMKQSWTMGITGSFAPEVIGGDLGADQDFFQLGASVYYNNYNGVGLSIDPSISFGGEHGDFSVGLSIDTESGLGVNASVSLARKGAMFTQSAELGLSFDGNLSLSTSLQASEEQYGNYRINASAGSSMSFARNNFIPSVGNRVNNYNVAVNIKAGAAVNGFFAGTSAGLFYNTQDFNDDDKKGRKRLVVGYTEATVGMDNHYTRDFMRSNDGQITKATMYLPSSEYSYDVYNSTGQGLSSYFRARRSDIGRSCDPHVYNVSAGINGSFDVGPPGHAGFGIGANFGFDSQDAWDEYNTLKYDFKNPATSGRKENVYYQVHGEQTILHKNELDYVKGLELINLKLQKVYIEDVNYGYNNLINEGPLSFSSERNVADRVVRNTLVHNLKNGEVAKLGEFKVNYFTDASQTLTYPTANNTTALRRDVRHIHVGEGTESVNIGNHPAGFKVLNQEGSYYVYGLPAYNTKEIECSFSTNNPTTTAPGELDFIDAVDPNSTASGDKKYMVPNTDKYINKTTKSPYAHSYMLTAVQGADYVDIDNNGPSDKDLGYWVKFNYYTPTEGAPYKWRTPYHRNQYSAGSLWTMEDDKASYQYGEKELWYLAQIETKSHIAVFVMSLRNDMKEATGEFDPAVLPGMAGMQVDEIRIYDKKTFKENSDPSKALQIVHFKYDDPLEASMCQGTPNALEGKLTLQEVWFTSNGSTRGELNRYKFDYLKQYNGEYDVEADNPNYAPNSYDSWGGYKPKGSSHDHNTHFPYVNQFNQNWDNTVWEPGYNGDAESYQAKERTQERQNQLVSSWALKKITLPSGGIINVNYESDDYGYVQHKTANQMFKIEKMGDFDLPGHQSNDIYDMGDLTNGEYYDESSTSDELKRRIYFKLEYPIPVNSTSIDAVNLKVYNKYVEPIIEDESGQRNLFFKTKIELTESKYEYVSGYLPLEEGYKKVVNSADHYNVGVKLPTGPSNLVDVDGNGTAEQCYTHGFVTVTATKKKNGSYFEQYHPLALAAWTFMQTNTPKLLHESFGESVQLGVGESGSATVSDIVNGMTSLLSIVPATASSFGLIRKYCQGMGYARKLDLNNSVIRLASPDKKKFGGGHRVKEITITDNWNSDVSTETSRTYGQHYDYTMKENGETISSGVAQYEPQAGGDENALKYPMYYHDKQNLFTNNNLFAEAPLNESLFPGANVGYRKVTVKSINTEKQLNLGSSGAQGRTGGVTVHEFYTAKEFPTLVETTLLSETENTKDYFNVPIPIPLVGSIKRLYYHGTQSYKIELNDMHGKPKSVESFEINGYTVNPTAITSTTYEYQCTPIIKNGEKVFQLDNEVAIIANNGTHRELLDGQGNIDKRLMGVEVDVFTDQRETKSFQTSASFNNNVEFSVLPFPDFWITYSNHKTMFRTYVTNKVVHKTGILKKTKTQDLQTINETEILAYDEKSGNPLLSRIKNEFGDDFYSYNIPAYYAYDRMGHAYQNINYTFETDFSPIQSDPNTVHFSIDADEILNLVRGDELLIVQQRGMIPGPDLLKKGYFIGWDYTGSVNGTTPTSGILHVDGGLSNLSAQNVTLKVIRSGYRNHSSSMAANYLTKGKLDLETAPLDILTNEDGSIIQTKKIKGNVLSATASLYKDDWLTADVSEKVNLAVIDNPFLTGNSGIFRPYKSYTYVGKRKQKENTTTKFSNDNTTFNPELYNDGVMSDVPMFSWDLGNLEEYASTAHWEWVNEVTKYSSDAYEVENVNRLGIYSSALYGYDNSLTIGVGGNSSYFELGVVDFETAKADFDENSWEFGESMKQTNMNFYNGYNPYSQFMTLEHYNIKSAKYLANGNIEVVADIPFSYYTSVSARLEPNYGLTLNSSKNNALKGNRDYYFNATCEAQQQAKSTGGHVNAPCAVEEMIGTKSYTKLTLKPTFATSTNPFNLLPTDARFTGKIGLLLNRPVTYDAQLATLGHNFVSNKAHTGKKSMQVVTPVRYDQFKLKLVKNKKYVVSMWISRDNTDVSTYITGNYNPLSIGYMSGNVFTAVSNAKYTYGKVIEGWQKVDAEFSINADDPVMSIKLDNGSSPLYIDDVRFSPKTGGITTYVYDPVKFWLRASLNVDNYATLFFYDEEGNLTLKKQETEKGIFTITESRGHVSEGN